MERPQSKSAAGSFVARWAPLLLVALVAAAAIGANLWNAPAIAVLLVFAGAARATRGEGLPRLGSVLSGALTGAGVVLVALVLTQPYRVSYQLPYNGIGKTHATSGIFEFLGVWGILFAVAAAGLLLSVSEDTEEGRRRRDFLLAAAAVVSLAVAFAKKAPALALIFFLAFLAGRPQNRVV